MHLRSLSVLPQLGQTSIGSAVSRVGAESRSGREDAAVGCVRCGGATNGRVGGAGHAVKRSSGMALGSGPC